jgi:hypothetical protein
MQDRLNEVAQEHIIKRSLLTSIDPNLIANFGQLSHDE